MEPASHAEARARRAETAVLAALLLFAWGLKLRHHPAPSTGFDGAYYYQTARRVAEGHGLETTVSIFHQGLAHLPARSNVYPLWPLALGEVGRVLGMWRAASVLPEGLYLLDALLAYVLVTRVLRRFLGERVRPFRRVPVHAGHLAAGLLAFTPVFFFATSLPYTEALAFAMLLASLLFVDSAGAAAEAGAAKRAALLSALAGLFAGLSYLTRFQLVLAIAAVPLALALSLRGRGGVRCGLLALAAALLPFAGEAGYLARFPGFTPAMLVDYTAYHETPGLARLGTFEPTAGGGVTASWLKERLDGLLVSFDPNSAYSYAHSMGPVVYAPFLVLGLALAVRGRAAALVRGLASPRGAAVLASILFGVVLTLPTHLMPATFWQKYLFSWRHGVPLLFLVVPALAWLLARPDSVPRWAAAAAAVFSLWNGVDGCLFMLEPHDWPQKGLREAGAFLNAHPGTNALVLSPPALSVFTENGLYWNDCDVPPDVLTIFRDKLPIDWVLLRPGERDCPSGKWLFPQLTEVAKLGEGLRDYTVYRWSNRPDPSNK
jgi:hypothetical protein